MQLLPIIRRVRRPLIPADDAAPVVPPAVVELPPPVPPVEAKAKKAKRANAPA